MELYINPGSCCYQIVLDNRAHSGKVKISLQNQASIKECKDPNVSGHGEWMGCGGRWWRCSLVWLLMSAVLSVTFSTAFDPSHLAPLLSAESYAREFFDVLVAFVCLLSLLLCGRSVLRGILLQHVRRQTKHLCIHVVRIRLYLVTVKFPSCAYHSPFWI